MAQEKTIYSRQQQKHDIEFNWLKATNFIPKEGEIIVYDAEDAATVLPEGRINPINYARIKIGDGKTNINQLSFSGNNNLFTFRIARYEEDGSGGSFSCSYSEIVQAIAENKTIIAIDEHNVVYTLSSQDNPITFVGLNVEHTGDTPTLVQWWFSIFKGEGEGEDWIEIAQSPDFVTLSDVTIESMISEKTPLLINLSEVDLNIDVAECEYSVSDLYEKRQNGQNAVILYKNNLYNCIYNDNEIAYFLAINPAFVASESGEGNLHTFSTETLELFGTELSTATGVFDQTFITDYILNDKIDALMGQINTSNSLMIKIEGEEGDLRSSHTYEEITEALNNNIAIQLLYNNKIYNFSRLDEGYYIFSSSLETFPADEEFGGEMFWIPLIGIYEDSSVSTEFGHDTIASSTYALEQARESILNDVSSMMNMNDKILIVTSYHDEEYGDIASHGPFEIYEAINNDKLAYLLYKDLVFTCTHVGESEEAEFRAVDNENYNRVVYIGAYLKNDAEDEWYYSISEAEIGSYGKILLDFDLNNYHEEQLNNMLENGFYVRQEVDGEQEIIRNVPTYDELPQKMADAILDDYEEEVADGNLTGVIDMIAWSTASGVMETFLEEREFITYDEESGEYRRNVPIYEEMTPGFIGAAYGEFLCIELTEEDGVLYANYTPSIIIDIVRTNVSAYLSVEGKLLPCVSLNENIAKFYDINTHSVYSISNEDGTVTVETIYPPSDSLIVTMTEDGTTDYTAAEIYNFISQGKTVYLFAYGYLYIRCSSCSATEARFEDSYISTITAANGASYDAQRFRTFTIANNKKASLNGLYNPGQGYIDAQIGSIETALNNIITIQTQLIGEVST